MGDPQLYRIAARGVTLRALLGRARQCRFGRAAAIIAAACLWSAGPGAARPLDEVKASNLLRVVVYEDNKPFSWTDQGVVKGIEAEIARRLARKLGVEVEILARMQGEEVDDDLRANIWRGPLTGGAVGDVMLHVPIDRELVIRNKEAVMGQPYYEQRISIAVDTARTGENPPLDVFKREKIGVQLGTVADYFLMFYEGGALRPNIGHFLKPADGLARFVSKEFAGLMGVRSHIEGLLHEKGVQSAFAEPPMPGIVRSRWPLGIAVKENSRDLFYAVGNLLAELQSSGELTEIFKSYGVTYVQPEIK